MQIKSQFNKALPHLTAIVIFLVLSFVYFYPVLEGKVLKANDAQVAKFNSKEIQDYREKEGKDVLWTNSIFSGMPSYLISVKHPGNLLAHLDSLIRRIVVMPVAIPFLCMAGFYLLLILFGVNPWISIIGSLAYGLSSFTFQVLAAGHNTQAIALAYVAPVIGSIYYAYRRDAVKGALLTAFFLALEILANHPQITYYAMMCLGIFIIVEFIGAVREKKIAGFFKTSALLIAPFIIALGINFASLYTVWEYGKYSIRGKSDLVKEKEENSKGLDKDYITMWSYGVDETFNLLIPNYKGGSSKPLDRDSETARVLRQYNNASAINSTSKYWGPQPLTEGPHYMGAIVIFLFILGLIIVKGPEKWWLLIATLFSIMLSWGKYFMPLTNLFIDYFPGYNKFRSVTMILVVAQFCMPLLGVLALRDIFSGTISRKELLKGIKIAGGITAGFLLLTLLLPAIAGSFLAPYENDYPAAIKDALVSDRKALLRTDSLRSLVFILFAGGAILAFLFEKLKKEYALLLLGLLIVFDLYTVDRRYLGDDRFESPNSMKKSLSPSPADAIILKDKSYYRVLNLATSLFNDNSPTSYFHKSVGGYHGAKMERYQELADSCIYPALGRFEKEAANAKSLEDFQNALNNNPVHVFNMLNAKYIILNPGAPPLVNSNALGNAWFAEKPLLVDNANQEISMVNKIDPAKEAVVDKKFGDQIKATAYPVSRGDTIYLSSYSPDEMIYKYSAGSDKLAVFSEIYYPAGWKSYIDGKENKYFRTDYVLRGMILPQGQHEVKFTFRPSSYYTGNKVSLASSILLILLIAGYAGYAYRKK